MLSSYDGSMSLYLLMKIPLENCVWNRKIAQTMSLLDGRKYPKGEKSLQERIWRLLIIDVIFLEANKDVNVRFGN